MARLVWDNSGDHLYETGVKNCVLYTATTGQDANPYGKATAWNGITSISESPSGAEATALWADDIKYLNLYSAEEFGATIEAYTYPDEFAACDGSKALVPGAYVGQQTRETFGLCYTTTLGNDLVGNDYGYKLHLIYGCKASPSEKAYSTINDSPEAITFSWELTTTPVAVAEGFKPTSYIVIDSTKVDKDKLDDLLDKLYGTDGGSGSTATNGYLPLPAEVKSTLQ